MNKLILLISLVLTVAVLGGCGNINFTQELAAPPDEELTGVSVWAVYWDLDDAADRIHEMSNGILGVSAFAAYFDENDGVFIPENLQPFIEQIKFQQEEKQWDYYLTIVNDQRMPQGSSLKDTDLLRRLFADDASMFAHIEEIIALTVDNGYDGVEIDYEAIRSDMELWERFAVFCGELYSETERAGIKLRVILEPNAPLEKLTLPEGPEYVMMCYNLFGYDKKAGPKANDSFILEMVDKMAGLPGHKMFALASGGYDWQSGQNGVQITEREARLLVREHNAVIYRSSDSGALTFQYRDAGGSEHTVWYADSKTLCHWQNLILENGSDYGIMLWRVE